MVSRRDKINQRNNQDRAVSPERVRKVQTEENTRYRDECSKRGFKGDSVKIPQYEVNKTLFDGADAPSGKPESWPESDKKKQSIAKKRATDAIVEKDVRGKKPIINVSVEETLKAKQDIEKDGVDKLWDFLFGDRHKEESEQLNIFEQQQQEEESDENDEDDDKKDDGKGFKFFIIF